MKKVLIIFFLFNLTSSHCQSTTISDPNFEQALINLGYDNVIDGAVPTSAIDTVTELDIYNLGISDLGGIEDFVSLKVLICSNNPLNQLNISNNQNLEVLYCDSCQLTSLNLTNNLLLKLLSCSYNDFTQLNLAQNIVLTHFFISFTKVEALDLSNHNQIFSFNCTNNQFLSCLNLKDGDSSYSYNGFIKNNPLLTCIEVDNPSVWQSYATSYPNWFDSWVTFSTNCNNSCSPVLSLEEANSEPKKLVKIMDLMGRESEVKPNTVLIYVYSDGTSNKVFQFE